MSRTYVKYVELLQLVSAFPRIEQTLSERFLQNTPGCLSVFSCVVECVCPFGAYHIKIDLIFVKAS